jgi:hypothetical protein
MEVSTSRKIDQNWQQITLRSVTVSAGGTVTSSVGTDVSAACDCLLVDDRTFRVNTSGVIGFWRTAGGSFLSTRRSLALAAPFGFAGVECRIATLRRIALAGGQDPGNSERNGLA